MNHNCHNCGKNCFDSPKDYYMLKDHIWLNIHPQKNGMLCMACAEQKLGRPLKQDDILICPLTVILNPYTASLLNGLRECKKVRLKYKSRRSIRWNKNYK